MTFTGTPLMAAVAISWEFIWNDPSPAMQTTVVIGVQPTAAPMAAGKPKPMVPRPPLEERKDRVGNSRGEELVRPHLVLAHLGGDDGGRRIKLGVPARR